MVAVFGMGDRDFFCKQCGFAVCEACSKNKRYLSKDSKEKFRVCDLCDTKLDNIKLRQNMDKFLILKDEKLKMTE
jgi:FYVE zinc finger